VEIKEYLSEDQMRDISEQMYRDKVAEYLKDEENFKRVLSNSAYDIVYDMVDNEIEEGLKPYLYNKVLDIIKNLSEFHIFKKPDAWSRETNSGYQTLEKCIIENKDILNSKVKEALETMSKKQYQYLTKEAIQSMIEKTFKA